MSPSNIRNATQNLAISPQFPTLPTSRPRSTKQHSIKTNKAHFMMEVPMKSELETLLNVDQCFMVSFAGGGVT